MNFVSGWSRFECSSGSSFLPSSARAEAETDDITANHANTSPTQQPSIERWMMAPRRTQLAEPPNE